MRAGGTIPEDYLFDGDGERVKLSELSALGKDTLAISSFMYGPERERPCPGCTHFLDGLDGMVEHISQRINLAVVAKSPLPRILAFGRERGWRRLPLLSTAGNIYDRTTSATGQEYRHNDALDPLRNMLDLAQRDEAIFILG